MVQIFDGLTTLIVSLVAAAIATLLIAIVATLLRMRRDKNRLPDFRSPR